MHKKTWVAAVAALTTALSMAAVTSAQADTGPTMSFDGPTLPLVGGQTQSALVEL